MSFTNSLQENLIVLLTWDTERAPVIKGTVDPALYSGIYRTLVARIYDYIDRFKKPPADHLPDILSDKLEGTKNPREAETLTEIIESIYANKERVNAEYVMSQLESFIKRQTLSTMAIDLVKALQRGTEESIDEAERLIASANRSIVSVFDPGTRLSDKTKVLQFLDVHQTAFPTGIPELDKRGFGPTRKELWLYIADAKSGKTFALTQMAKMAAMHKLKVSHITLEMSEARSAQRYLQAFFAIAKRPDAVQTVKFEKDELGRVTGFEDVRVVPRLSLEDQNIKPKLAKLVDKWSARLLDNVIVKQFPTGQLTIAQLRAYLDNLETTQQFIPDLLIVDYPDLMKLPNRENPRLGIDEIYKDLRGIAVEHNIAVAVVSQSHRGASKAKQVRADNVAEAYTKVAHADTIITYSCTEAERALGLARLHVAAGRNDEDGITIIISQQYGLGNFVVDSTLMKGNYFGLLPKQEGSDD